MSQRKKSVANRRKGNLQVKTKFKRAVMSLRRMKANNQRQAVAGASNAFIKDVSSVMNRIRNNPHTVSAKHKKVIKRHRKLLRKLVNKNTSIAAKRKILLQKGGIVPFLIPIICASIGAAGSVAGAAVASAVGSAVARA